MSITSPAAPLRLTLGRRVSPPLDFALATGLIALPFFASSTPSPLYADYAARWHFTTPVLTAVYAVYAFGVLAALLLVGRLSDQTGRRPVLAASLIGLLGATALFMLASSVGWLFAARGLQGIATGAALGAAGAALLDLHPRGDARHAGLVNGVVSALGIGAGALISAIIVQALPDPRVTPFVLLAILFALALVATALLPETVTRAERPRLRPQRPAVPALVRREFTLASLGVISSWTIGGLYLALGPTLAAQLLHSHSHLAGGAAVFALAGAGSLSQVLFRGLSAARSMAVGAVVLAVGMAATAASLSAGSAVPFFVASAVTGLGFGVAFMGAIRLVSSAAPLEHRASVMSAFYIVAYLAISVPTVVAGLLVPSVGLEPTFRIFSGLVVVVALLTAVGTRRLSRPQAAGRA